MIEPGRHTHPRLLVPQERFDRLQELPKLPIFESAAKTVAANATNYLDSVEFDYPLNQHNAHLIRARTMQCRIITLIVRWYQTGDKSFRDAAVEHVREMGRWEYWSWITWRRGDPSPNAIFDLSYGENSTTLALAYDWLFDSLSDEERAAIVQIATDRAIRPFMVHTEPESRAWWYGKPDSNWNTVCAGGAGMLALAMREDLEDAETVIARAEESIAPFMHELDQTHGGWPEGIGYWNYGMQYAFLYLLSWERATGKAHPLLESPAVAQTLSFPLDFCPNAVACSFGDANNWVPQAFHYATAERLGCAEVLAALDAQFENREKVPDERGNAAMLLLLHPDNHAETGSATEDVHQLYPGIDWGILADRMPNPKFYLSVRGGSTKVPHSQLDLLSFNCVVGDEKLIVNIGPKGYLDSTFSGRRWDLFEMSPQSKNTVLINGVGITPGSAVFTESVVLENARGFRIDSTEAIGAGREGRVVRLCERFFLMLSNNHAALVVDRVYLNYVGLVEQRFHTEADITIIQEASALLRGRKQQLQMSCVCDQPAVLLEAGTALTHPIPGPKVLRFCLANCCQDAVLATMLTPGASRASVTLDLQNDCSQIVIKHPDWQEVVTLPPTAHDTQL